MSKIKKSDTLGIIGIVNENKTKLEIIVFSIFEDKKHAVAGRNWQ